VLAVWAKGCPGDQVEVFTVADSSEPVRCAKGVRVLPDRTWQSLGQIDVLVYPGGRGVMTQLGDEHVRRRLRDVAANGALMTSVCTCALAYADDAGLLDGRPATTHWSALDDRRSPGTGTRTETASSNPGRVPASSGPALSSLGRIAVPARPAPRKHTRRRSFAA
jgi:putative intracellular protease/amidase